MAKISFANLKLKVNDTVQTVKCGDAEIEVLQYLPIADKADLISITVQQAMENGIIHPVKLEQYFCLNIMYLYSNFNFTDKQKEDPDKLYDILESNGIIDTVISAIPESEVTDLYDYLKDYMEGYKTSRESFANVVYKVLEDLPGAIETAREFLKDFDPSQFKEVIAFAQGANANRPIPESDSPIDKAFNEIGQN